MLSDLLVALEWCKQRGRNFINLTLNLFVIIIAENFKRKFLLCLLYDWLRSWLGVIFGVRQFLKLEVDACFFRNAREFSVS